MRISKNYWVFHLDSIKKNFGEAIKKFVENQKITYDKGDKEYPKIKKYLQEIQVGDFAYLVDREGGSCNRLILAVGLVFKEYNETKKRVSIGIAWTRAFGDNLDKFWNEKYRRHSHFYWGKSAGKIENCYDFTLEGSYKGVVSKVTEPKKKRHLVHVFVWSVENWFVVDNEKADSMHIIERKNEYKIKVGNIEQGIQICDILLRYSSKSKKLQGFTVVHSDSTGKASLDNIQWIQYEQKFGGEFYTEVIQGWKEKDCKAIGEYLSEGLAKACQITKKESTSKRISSSPQPSTPELKLSTSETKLRGGTTFNKKKQTGLMHDRHSQIQKKLYNKLVKKHGKKRVGLENPYGLKKIDLVVEEKDGYIFYEIKTSDNVGACIREALGQIFEYAYSEGKENAKKLIIVGYPSLDEKNKKYLVFLRKRFNVPIYYEQIEMK